jgi:protease-4
MIRTLLLAACVLCSAAAADHGAEAAPKPSKDGTLVMRMHGGYQLRPPSHLFGDGDASLHEACMALKRALAAPEPRLVLDCSNAFHPGLAAAEELASVIRDNKKGKKVSILLDEADDQALVVAAACDEVVMPEAGLLDVDGISLSSYYFADALAKIGVKFHAVASGEHKTAHEALTRGSPSDAAKEELTQLANELDATLLALSARPTLTVDELKAARAKAPQPSSIAAATKLVDAAAEPGDWLAKLPAPQRVMKDAKRDVPDLSSMSGMIEFWAQLMQGAREERQPKVVAVVELAGTIVDGRDGDPGVNVAPGDTCELLDQLRDDARVVAVVLRVDSPGGSASASDRIHHAVRRLDEKKPVVALFDSVAASGGYYIGCAAREILVHRATITGSIGVFGIAPDASGALEALGVHRYTVATGPRADLLGLGPWTDEKEAALKQVIADVDARFQGLVAARRKIEPGKVAGLAGGRVYTGEKAVTLGLADGLGTLASAVARARQLAGEAAPLPLERYPKDGGLLGRLGLAQSSVGPVPASLRLWLEVARAHAPTVLAWTGISP